MPLIDAPGLREGAQQALELQLTNLTAGTSASNGTLILAEIQMSIGMVHAYNRYLLLQRISACTEATQLGVRDL